MTFFTGVARREFLHWPSGTYRVWWRPCLGAILLCMVTASGALAGHGQPAAFAAQAEGVAAQAHPTERFIAALNPAVPMGFTPAQSPDISGGVSGWLWRGGIAVLGLPLLIWFVGLRRSGNTIDSPGFEVITDSEQRRFIPLTEKYQQLDFVSKIKTEGSLRLSANLNKVSLSIRRFGYLMEDRNFRNALLVNRRRVRRTVLKDGDVLDLGDLTLLYRDNRIPPLIRHSSVTPPAGKASIKFDRPRGPVRKGTGMLVLSGQPARTFYFTKNLVFIGRSESNDLVIKAHNVDYRHAKIEKVGGRYKLINLVGSNNTFVNNRRVEHRILKDGDVIAFDTHAFKFALATTPVRERPQRNYQSKGAPSGEKDDRDSEDGRSEAGRSAGA